MQAQMRVGRDRVPAPRFSIGDAVVHLTDTENSPEGEWHDALDPAPRFFWWYRGIVVSVEFDYRYRRIDQESPWIYHVRVCQGFDGCGVQGRWECEPLLMLETELKRSSYTARYFDRPEAMELPQMSVAR